MKQYIDLLPQEKLLRIFLIGMIASLSLITLLHFDLRLTSIHIDDGPVFYAFLMTHLERFSQDVISLWGQLHMYGSIAYWLPWQAQHLLNIEPVITTQALLLLQNILLFTGVWRMCRLLTQNTWFAALALSALYLLHPWAWNLAGFDAQGVIMQWQPYAGHLALGAALHTLAAAAHPDKPRWLHWFAFCCLAHPTMSLYTLAIIGLLQVYEHKWAVHRVLFPMTIAAGLLALAILNTQLRTLDLANPLSEDALYWGLVRIIHVRPWQYAHWPTAMLSCLFAYIATALIVFRLQTLLTPAIKKLWIVTAVATVIFAALHLLADFTQFNLVLKAVPLRSTVILSMISYVLMMYILFRCCTGPFMRTHWVGIVVILLCVIPMPHQQSIICLSVLGLATLLGADEFESDKPQTNPIPYMLIAGLCLLVPYQFKEVLGKSEHFNQAVYHDKKSAQHWIAQHTPENARIGIYGGGWRTLGHRVTVPLHYPIHYRYYSDESVKAQEDKLISFYELEHVVDRLSGPQINQVLFMGFYALQAQQLHALSEQLNFNYVIYQQPKKVDLPIAYQNKHFIIYKIAKD